MRRWLWVIMTVAMVSLAASACGGGDSVDLPGGGEITKGKLPDDWPNDFPVYGGAKLLGHTTEFVDGAATNNATWETGDSPDDVKQFYDDAFKDGPWRSESSGVVAGGAFWLATKGEGAPAYVTVIGEGDKTLIVVLIGDTVNDIVDPDADETSADAGSGSGGGELPAEVALPDDFPSDQVPLPDGIRITNASSVDVGGAQSFLVQFYSQDSTDDLAAFFKDKLEGKGLKQSIQQSQDGGIFAVYAENDDGSGALVSITIIDSDVDGYRQVTLQITSS